MIEFNPHQKEGMCTECNTQTDAVDNFLTNPLANHIVCNQNKNWSNQKPANEAIINVGIYSSVCRLLVRHSRIHMVGYVSPMC